jgi:hypothetical protein
MSRMLKTSGFVLIAAVALTVVLPAPAQAQVVIVPSAPVVRTYYAAPTYVVPSISYSVPATYVAPRVSYYPPPVVTTTYAAPVVTTYYAAPAATVVSPAPGVYTTTTYRTGLGIWRPRYVSQTYYTPLP